MASMSSKLWLLAASSLPLSYRNFVSLPLFNVGLDLLNPLTAVEHFLPTTACAPFKHKSRERCTRCIKGQTCSSIRHSQTILRMSSNQSHKHTSACLTRDHTFKDIQWSSNRNAVKVPCTHTCRLYGTKSYEPVWMSPTELQSVKDEQTGRRPES